MKEIEARLNASSAAKASEPTAASAVASSATPAAAPAASTSASSSAPSAAPSVASTPASTSVASRAIPSTSKPKDLPKPVDQAAASLQEEELRAGLAAARDARQKEHATLHKVASLTYGSLTSPPGR
jgi:hypothetical protein